MILLGFVRPVSQREGTCSNMENEGLFHYKGYTARPEYSVEDCIFYGKILGISDLVEFQSKSAKDLEDAFHKAVDDYLEFCGEAGKLPQHEHISTKTITVPELEADPNKYVELAQLQDVLIVRNGKVVAKLTSVEHRKG